MAAETLWPNFVRAAAPQAVGPGWAASPEDQGSQEGVVTCTGPHQAGCRGKRPGPPSGCLTLTSNSQKVVLGHRQFPQGLCQTQRGPHSLRPRPSSCPSRLRGQTDRPVGGGAGMSAPRGSRLRERSGRGDPPRSLPQAPALGPQKSHSHLLPAPQGPLPPHPVTPAVDSSHLALASVRIPRGLRGTPLNTHTHNQTGFQHCK